jgi:tetratricopeptide (TPR) repeat protein
VNRKERRAQSKAGAPAASDQIAQWFGQAVALHQAGRLGDAIGWYRKVLTAAPSLAEAHHNLGIALKGLGKIKQAIVCYDQALALNPLYADAHNSRGNALADLGDWDHAIAAFRQAIAVAPNYCAAHNNLGTVLKDQGHPDQACDCFDRALAIDPRYAEAHNNKGAALHDLGRYDAALDSFARALALEPDHARALANRAGTLFTLGRYEEALAGARRAVTIAPALAFAHNTLGNILKAMGRIEEAVPAYQAAVAQAPHLAELHDNLGNALSELGHSTQAEAACRAAIKLRPDFAKAYNNLGTALRDQGRRDEALAAFRTALDLDPAMAAAHTNIGMALLYEGDFAHGWAEFEWRWQTGKLPDKPVECPRWSGQDLRGKTLLLYAEQGLGDVLHFIRYASLLAQQGARVIAEVQPSLARLIGQTPGVDHVIKPGDPLPAFDYCLPLMSAPLRLGTTEATIPATVPYLTVRPEWSDPWRDRVAALPGLKVGIVWAGDPRPFDANANAADRRRSIPLAQWAPVLALPGISFVSLQMGGGRSQLAEVDTSLRPHDWTDGIGDFADTAGLAAHLDLVISVDTSVAHLAGGMGKPVWILSRYDGCWRWLKQGITSPWYPSATLFRQSRPGDWSPVMAQVAQALGVLALNAARQ